MTILGLYKNREDVFRDHLSIYWSNLSRLNNLLMVMNISMFFLTGLVSRGYYYTFISMGCLLLVGLGGLVPVACLNRLWYYLIYMILEITGLYFLSASVVYWIRTGAVI